MCVVCSVCGMYVYVCDVCGIYVVFVYVCIFVWGVRGYVYCPMPEHKPVWNSENHSWELVFSYHGF